MNAAWKDERGQALVMVSLFLIAILAILGLTVDVGWAFFRKQAAQSAVESAALSAVKAAQQLSATFTCGTDVECASTPSACPSAPISATLSPSYNNLQIGCYYASQNGFSVGSSSVQNVTMAAGTGAPTTVPNVTTKYWVTARATESIPQLFSAIIPGHTTIVSSARATAGILNFVLSGCVYTLSDIGTDDSEVGNATFNATFCSINVDSDSASAVTLNGNATINAASLNVVGPASCAGQPTCGISGSGGLGSTPVNTGITPFPDPLAAEQPPALGTCLAAVQSTSHTAVNLSPGTFCGGISVTGQANVTFAPGVYILDGGGLTLSGGGNISGSGVMFYNTFDSTHAFAPMDVEGSGTISLTAPSSGPYQGLLFFEDRNAPASTEKFAGGSNLNLVGDLYFKNSTVKITGSGSSTDVAIVANKLTLSGNGSFTETNLSSASAPSAPVISLIE